MKTIINKTIAHFTLMCGVVIFVAGCLETKTQGPGNSTEAENALAFIVVDKSGSVSSGVGATLCENAAACDNPVAESVSDDSGKVLIDSVSDGSYFLTCTQDTLQKSMKVTFTGGKTLDLGRVELSDSGLIVLEDSTADSVAVWVGTWAYQSVGDSSTEEWGFILGAEDTFSSWRYEWWTAVTDPGISHAPADSLWAQGTWSDAGTFVSLFPSYADSIPDSLLTFYSNVHILLFPITSIEQNMRWTGGFLFYPTKDSLLFLGDVDVYQGESSTLVGIWENTYTNADVQKFVFTEENTVSITQGDTVSSGTWAINGAHLEISWDNSTLSKFYTINNGKLILLDFDDGAVFYRRE